MKKVLTVFSVLLALLLLMPDAFAGDRVDAVRNVDYERGPDKSPLEWLQYFNNSIKE